VLTTSHKNNAKPKPETENFKANLFRKFDLNLI
jgi:hypothetical protein